MKSVEIMQFLDFEILKCNNGPWFSIKHKFFAIIRYDFELQNTNLEKKLSFHSKQGPNYANLWFTASTLCGKGRQIGSLFCWVTQSKVL